MEVTARGDAVIGVRALGARLLEASRRVSMSRHLPWAAQLAAAD